MNPAGGNPMNPGNPQPQPGGMAGPLPEPGGPNPGVGEIIFTEIMYNPKGSDSTSEWFEIHNVTDRPLSLEDCVVSDETGEISAGEIVLAPGNGRDSFAIYARSADAQVLGNVAVNGVFEFALNNNRDRLTLTCGGVVIDVVDYDIDFNSNRDSDSFPLTDGFSIALDPNQQTAEANDDGGTGVSRKNLYRNAHNPVRHARGTEFHVRSYG